MFKIIVNLKVTFDSGVEKEFSVSAIPDDENEELFGLFIKNKDMFEQEKTKAANGFYELLAESQSIRLTENGKTHFINCKKILCAEIEVRQKIYDIHEDDGGESDE